jgi:hypothetical protein
VFAATGNRVRVLPLEQALMAGAERG